MRTTSAPTRAAGSLAALVAIAALAACTPSSAPLVGGSTAEPTTGDVIVASTEVGDAAIDGVSGALLVGGEGVVATPDGRALFRATPDAGRTSIASIDPRSGTTNDTTSVRGEVELAVASVSGRALALVAPAPGAPLGSLPGVPMPRAVTPIVVADPAGEREPAHFRLAGNYEPEAFALDDRRLFMIQYLPAEAPAVYRVMVLDVDTGAVDGVTGRFKTSPERMPGVRLDQVYDPVRSQMYTLYSNQPGAYASGHVHGGGTGGSEETFVHVLNMKKGWAYCAGLPDSMSGGTARDQAIAPSPDGRSLYVVDARDGLIAVMDTSTLEVERTARVVLERDAEARTSLAVSRDGATLFVAASSGSASVAAIDTASLTMRDRWAAPLPISSLGLSADGASLYAAGGGRIAVVDAVSGTEVATLATPGLSPIVGLDPLPSLEAPA